MLKVGITGQLGFIGTHLYNTIGLFPEEFIRIEFQKEYFEDHNKLNNFVAECDVIVHLAAMNRHNDPQVIYDTNLSLVQKLVESLKTTKSNSHVIFSSSTQEERDNLYGKSKKEGRELMINWSNNSEGKFTGMIIPNVFGPFGHPNYNSVVATFCHKLAHNETPTIDVDGDLKLIYVGQLVNAIIAEIRSKEGKPEILVQHTSESKVSQILTSLEKYKSEYQDKGIIPSIENLFELNLFNTFRCYMDIKNHFPVKFVEHTDPRGSFVEIIRLGVGGQVSFSTTVPGITRGNHYHTRKIERFAVIKGKALIQLRRIGTEEVLDFYLDGNEPAYVDMPIWYTHNIKNIGEEVLYTNFWINEFYDPNDPDTYFENV
ncbi:NAD-dependent epimerase/dehydratase family protein [Flavobacterium sp. Fl-77]|uniref:NAD-dependent epimerase/dehydratase family protein n=1 Tax=Flavobacterium flavipigmentatum TaxID=2893884 RepID=A0AAJ2SGY8_9FLAO|nr:MULTISPECIES: NAD-dependent epimerase/dehydratase family protein [unclassified Flavobacterium]MDX6182214.1 NAD-dependent epimerase/dehydratase family protein [Flavobacterium sp. Fl-33]MDX6185873.1 NAD-dependent epimerase/dehydratase family protein [Flavobacterium sp. Fl-77]UFH39051.1 NAD-dependent epimerase/dehydratase family protein [Flavobacterium sp. F-70]